MGYTTDFEGHVTITPPLNHEEVEYLNKFADTRRMKRTKGPYYVDNAGFAGQDNEDDILDYNCPDDSQPSLWCQWNPSDDGTKIEWDGSEKFYSSETWMAYLIDNFLKPGALASTVDDPQFDGFTFDHVVNGDIYAQGEDANDMWILSVVDNETQVRQGHVVYD